MNEEEKKAVEFVKKRTKELKKYAKRENELVYDDIILNLIEKLQKENEELKNENDKLNKELNEENKRCMMLAVEKQDYLEKYQYHLKQNESLTKEFSDYIPKQKIKDKIEEINKMIAYEHNDAVIIQLGKQKRVLQKLLESEE